MQRFNSFRKVCGGTCTQIYFIVGCKGLPDTSLASHSEHCATFTSLARSAHRSSAWPSRALADDLEWRARRAANDEQFARAARRLACGAQFFPNAHITPAHVKKCGLSSRRGHPGVRHPLVKFETPRSRALEKFYVQ